MQEEHEKMITKKQQVIENLLRESINFQQALLEAGRALSSVIYNDALLIDEEMTRNASEKINKELEEMRQKRAEQNSEQANPKQ